MKDWSNRYASVEFNETRHSSTIYWQIEQKNLRLITEQLDNKIFKWDDFCWSLSIRRFPIAFQWREIQLERTEAISKEMYGYLKLSTYIRTTKHTYNRIWVCWEPCFVHQNLEHVHLIRKQLGIFSFQDFRRWHLLLNVDTCY